MVCLRRAFLKCKKCIWSNRISKSVLYCIFPECIRKENKKDVKSIK